MVSSTRHGRLTATFARTRAGSLPMTKPLWCAFDISTRANVGTGDNVLIGGFIVAGSASKILVFRAIGPSLRSSQLTNVLADPALELHDASGALIGFNDDWPVNNSNAAQIQQIG